MATKLFSTVSAVQNYVKRAYPKRFGDSLKTTHKDNFRHYNSRV